MYLNKLSLEGVIIKYFFKNKFCIKIKYIANKFDLLKNF